MQPCISSMLQAMLRCEVCGAAYPRLLTWFEWFKRTQAGAVPGSFRWRGREPAVDYDSELNKKTFASGAYPSSLQLR